MAKQPKMMATATVADLISGAFSTFETLGGEYREWFDNLPEGLQDHRSDIDEAASTLENISEPDTGPAVVADVQVEYMPLTRKKQSRRDQGGQAVYELQIAIDFINEWLEVNAGTGIVDTDLEQEIERYRDEAQQMLDDAEGVEYPGMYA